MKFEKNYLVICENFIKDANNKVTLVNLFDVIYVDKLPAIHSSFFLVGNFRVFDMRKTDKELKLKFSILDPKGNNILSEAPDMRIELKHDQEQQPFGITNQINNLVFSAPGEYKFVLSANDEELGNVKLSVIQKKGVNR